MAKIAACLITKDSAGTIEAALDSIRPFVDGVFVYDTGSDDDTVELLERLNDAPDLWADPATGQIVEQQERSSDEPPLVQVPLAPITVKSGEWRDDFSWAREQSFAMPDPSYDWLLWLDDDDIVMGAQNLHVLADVAPAECDGYVVFYDYARDEAGQNVCQLWRERLLRRSAGYEWRDPIHEVLVPPEGRVPALAQLPPQQLHYVHNRPPDRYPPDRNLTILRRQHDEQVAELGAASPRVLAYLGTELMAKGEFAPAAPFLQQYVEHPEAAWSDERMQVHHKLAACLRCLGNPLASVEVEMLALRERDDWAETAVGLSQSFQMLGQWDRAERWARRTLELGMPQTTLIMNPLEFTLVPWMMIADCFANTGRAAQAQEAVGRALELAPRNEAVQARAQEIQRLAAENEIVGAILMLRETLVRHDENLKAWQLMNAVPYIVAERPEVVKARADQREMVAHYLRPDEYERWYRDEPKESTVPDDVVAEVGEHIPRAKRLLEGLAEQETLLGRKPRLLDLGSNDMWLGCYLWLNGKIVVDGVELNKQSVAKGLKRMATFGAPGSLVHGNLHDAKTLLNGRRYDAISLFEVLEHVPDTEQTLDLIEGLLKPGGVIYVSTPNGAYERGLIDGWHRVERKGHLRAIPVQELIDSFAGRGEIVNLELQHADRVTFASYRPRKRRGRVSFYAGAGWEPWSPASIRQGGLGGSETMLAKTAVGLAQSGWRTTVYSNAEPGLYAGVHFRPYTAWDPTDDPDLLVVSRLPHVFDNPLGAKHAVLWCHDHSYPGQLTEQRAAKMTSIVTLSEWQRQRFARLYPYAAGKLAVIRNGITLADGDDSRYPHADRSFAERLPRCVYSSSADRGLDVMLELWPRIREQAPGAELHVFYGWQVFDRVAMVNPALMAYKMRVLTLAEQAGGEAGGVFMRGRVGQVELAEEMQQARVWSYPTAFLETSCIGAMEARAAGLAVVTSDLAALRETAATHGHLIAWAADEDEPANQAADYQDAFVDAVVDRLTDEESWSTAHKAALLDVEDLDFMGRVPEWELLASPKRAVRPSARPKRRAKARAA